MELTHQKEPLLEFAEGTDVCPRSGIARHGVYDIRFASRRTSILLGAVGAATGLEKLEAWIERCQRVIPGKLKSRQPNLFPQFCGFNRESGFRASLLLDEEISRRIKNSEIDEILRISERNDQIEKAVELFEENIRFLAQNRNVDVIACVIPDKLYKSIGVDDIAPVEERIDAEESEDYTETNFRRLLKARTMPLGKPLQLIREKSLTPHSDQQDDATKAWNFCTALYYKASQTIPWRLMTSENLPTTCFAGVAFYRSRDRRTVQTSLAQIFDEMGKGVILRGTQIEMAKYDRVPHLNAEQANELLGRSLKEYEIAMETRPARLVVHKTSNFDDAEIEGFRAAAKNAGIGSLELLTLLDTRVRMFRQGSYPPPRGSMIELDDRTFLLATRGSVDHYETYPGAYVPQPLEVRAVQLEESPRRACHEILSLTKMNWNNTQFDGKYPITVQCARKVGQIMKYVPEGVQPQIRYSFYM